MPEFRDIFGYEPQAVAHAPGRVNLLGEHTDYNDGFVLPTTIPQTCRVELALSRDRSQRFYSAELNQLAKYHEGDKNPTGFARYVIGCIRMLRKMGQILAPIVLAIRSDVPIGAGLSSSAALEVAVLRGLRKLFRLKLDDVDIALIAQQAEIQYAGVNCGIMDQMASSLGDASHMLFLDTRTLDRSLLPLPEDSELIVLDSGVPRSLATSAYNQRRAECEEAARQLGVKALRDIDDASEVAHLPGPLDRRARHVVSENNRVLRAIEGVSAAEFGELMNASHTSLRDDFEVSIPALDILVELLQQHPEVYGARLTGAGFGGACVALAAKGATDAVKSDVLAAYGKQGQKGSVLV
ncbi:galactokinase [Methylocaldum sp.]|uniref:galactokinase n=1 Tax=Methylocaldum sp. TaxID=1969727 RepID=UPI002D603C40|nr:galactokinase [Methylocaldum sp.]HYE37343.1 galactokinase [Methylocaldum sp.]